MTVQPFPRPHIPRWLIIVVAVGFLVLAFGRTVATFYTDAVWFDAVGYSDVFWRGISSRLSLWIGFGILGALLFGVNVWLVARRAPSPTIFRPDDPLERARAAAGPFARRAAIIAAIIVGFSAGGAMSLSWRSWLLYRNAVEVGQTDPVFGRDFGYYLFRLPFERAVITWGFGLLIFTLIVTLLTSLALGAIRPEAPAGRRVPGDVRAHLSILAGVLILLRAAMYRLDQFDLLYSSRGQVTGASYTDVNAELPALKLLVLISIVCAILFFVNARIRNWTLPISGLALLVLTAIVAGGIYPALVQRFRVTPNERERETPFIERNIAATREAYGLTDVQIKPFPARGTITAADVAKNRPTLENIRLWDPRVLIQAYPNLQRIKQYYEFLDVDVDRYMLGGERRLVMLSGRELDLGALEPEARTWLNEHLVYTHGYGVVASRTDRVTSEGQPSLILENIPTESVQGAPEVTQPRIYFGEAPSNYIVVGSEQKELDFPQGDRFAETTYSGGGGVPLNGFLRRLAFAWRFGDVNLMISGAITGDSQILMRRQISDRVVQVLPFITPDGDPYLTVQDGRLVWMIDGYTTSQMWPYSERIEDFGFVSQRLVGTGGNYIRNAVKIAVDAENGTVVAYQWDEQDPVLKAWQKVFPDLILPRAEMPAAMLEHVRYPEGMFEVQTEMYENYHITDATNFYSKEDAWAVANDPTTSSATTSGQAEMPAYYMLMRLPGEDDVDFVLVRPFTPNSRQNLTGYMMAKGDADEYGQLVTYQLPKAENIFGPEQVHARINSDPVISPQLTLLDRSGSTVIKGNILIVPIEGSLLYVQPIYVRGQGSNLPELKFVAVVSGEEVKAGPTLQAALAALSSGGGGTTPPPPDGGPQKTVAQLLDEAIQAETAAQTALQRGDFAEYGRQRARTRRLLEQAAARANG